HKYLYKSRKLFSAPLSAADKLVPVAIGAFFPILIFYHKVDQLFHHGLAKQDWQNTVLFFVMKSNIPAAGLPLFRSRVLLPAQYLSKCGHRLSSVFLPSRKNKTDRAHDLASISPEIHHLPIG